MRSMVVTLEVSKFRGLSNADAPSNMALMLMTLDVSKLSGWSNAYALCRVERRAFEVRAAGGGIGPN